MSESLRKENDVDLNIHRVACLADLQERIGLVEGRVRKVREQIHGIRERMLGEAAAATALSLFDPLWETLPPAEPARVVGLLVERVDYDGTKGKVTTKHRRRPAAGRPPRRPGFASES